MSHYEQRLENDLNAIRQEVATLSAHAEKALKDAIHALQTGNRNLAFVTVLRDARINQRMRHIDGMCHSFIARHLPSAGHLRLMSSIIRTVIQLERVGDYAVTIAREGVQLSAPPTGPTAREVDLMSSHAIRMLGQAVAAFNEGNEDLAKATMGMGAHAESTFNSVYSDLTSESDPEKVKDLISLFVVFNMVKRVLDQAKNICEETVFTTTGETKGQRVHDVLFLDRDGTSLGPMAKLIAERLYPEQARYHCAAQQAAAGIDPIMKTFMDDHGYSTDAQTPETLDTGEESLSRYFVIVSLQDPIVSSIDDVPFHTSLLEWDLGDAPTSAEGYEEIYRELANHVQDLVETLTGTGDA